MARILPHTHKGVRVSAGLALLTLTLVCLLTSAAFGQVNMKDRYVSLMSGDQVAPVLARPAQTAFTVVVWESRTGDEIDIYAQMIDNNSGVPLWQPWDGVPVCTVSGVQRNPVAAYDSMGGVIIAWEDFRLNAGQIPDSTTVCEIYAHRLLLSTGACDPVWNAAPVGVPVCAGLSSIARDVSIAGSTDGAFIAWTDFRNASPYPAYNNRDVYIQYLLSATASWPSGNWVSNGIPAHRYTGDNQQRPALQTDYAYRGNPARYGVFVAFEDDRLGWWQIYALNLPSTGVPTWRDDVRVAPSAEDELRPCIASSGSPSLQPFYGAVVAWEDWRNYGATGVDVYSQRIDEAGTRYWPVGLPTKVGLALCTHAGDQGGLALSARGYRAFVAWEDPLNQGAGGGNGIDIYGNAIDFPTNSAVWSAASAEAICSLAEDQLTPAVDVGADMTYICWRDCRFGSSASDIYVQGYSTSNPTAGTRWLDGGHPVTQAVSAQTLPDILGEVLVWQDGRRNPITADGRNDENIYAELLGDECDAPTDMHWKDMYVKHTQGMDAESFRFVMDGEGHRYVVWTEVRPEHGDALCVFAQKLDVDGVPRWDNNGRLVNFPGEAASDPDVCIDGQGGAYVSWIQADQEVMLAQVSADGSNVVVVPVSPGYEARVVEDDQNGVYVGYLDPNDARFKHYDNISSQPTTNDVPNGGDASHLKLAKDYEGEAWLAWHSVPTGLHVAVIDNGAILDMAPSIVTASSDFDIATDIFPSFQAGRRLPAYNLHDLLVVYIDAGVPTVSRFAFNIGLVWEKGIFPFPVPAGTMGYHSPAIAVDSMGNDWYGNNAELGGAMVAWAHSYVDPATQDLVHDVETDRVEWIGGWGAVAGSAPWNSSLVLDQNLAFPPVVDIAAYFGEPGIGNPLGMVVWETDQFLSCATGYRMIASQLVHYTNNQQYAMQWTPNGCAVSPGIGNSWQRNPMVVTPYPTPPSHHVPVVWSDDRSGTACVLASSMFDTVENQVHRLDWRKEDRAADVATPLPLRIGVPTPQPYHLNGASALRIPLRGDGAAATLDLLDMAGRHIARIGEGILGGGNDAVYYTPAASLPAGVYLLRLDDGSSQSVRTVLFLR